MKDGWLTTDVFIETMKRFSEDQAMTDAATKVKTFTQLVDTTKEALGTGWAQTWRLIIGDFEQAKQVFTSISNFLSGPKGVITRIADARNKLIEGAMTKNFKSVFDKIKQSADGVKEAVKAIQDYSKVVDEIINGKWGNGEARWNKLVEAGYDWAHAQNLVNERLGDSTRHATDFKESQEELTETTNDLVKELAKLSEEELKTRGLENQIDNFKELNSIAKKLGVTTDFLIDHMEEMDGRWLLLNSFKNLGMSLVKIFGSMGEAWRNAFPPMSSDTLFDIIAGFYRFSNVISNYVDKNLDSFTRTLKGVFAILDLISMVIGGGLKIALIAVKTILNALGFSVSNVLDVTAILGDTIVSIRDFIEGKLVKGIQLVTTYIVAAVEWTIKWITQNEKVQNALSSLSGMLNKMSDGVKSWLQGLKETDNIPKYIIGGLVNGITKYGSKVIETIINLAKNVIHTFAKILRIESPSKVFIEMGKYIILGLVNGIKDGFIFIKNVISNLANYIIDIFNDIHIEDILSSNFVQMFKNAFKSVIEFIKNIDLGKVLAVGVGVALLSIVNKIINIIGKFTIPFEKLGGLIDSISGAFGGLEKNFKANALVKKSEALRNFAISIGILAGSIYILSKIENPDSLWTAVDVISALGIALLGITAVLSKIGNIKTAISGFGIAGIAAALLILIAAFKLAGKLDNNAIIKGIEAMTAFGVFAGILIMVSEIAGPNADKAGKMIKKITSSLLLLVLAFKLAGTLKSDDMSNGINVLTMFGIFTASLILISSISGKNADKAGKMISKISFSLLLLVGVFKLAGMLKPDDMNNGMKVLKMFGIFSGALIAVSLLAGKNSAKVGIMLSTISGSMLLLLGVIKLAGMLKPDEIQNGIKVLKMFGIFIGSLIAVSLLAGKNANKAGIMILEISTAIGLLVGVIYILSKMDQSAIEKSFGIISGLGLLFGGLIAVSKLANEGAVKVITKITISLGLLIAALVALSFIDPKRLLSSAGSLSAIMVALAILIASTSGFKNTNNILKTLLPITLIIGALAGIVALLSLMPNTDALIPAAESLSMLILALSASLAILSKLNVGKGIITGIAALAGLSGIVAILATILGVMSSFNINNAMSNATALSLLLVAMTGVTAALGLIGMMGPQVLLGIGAITLLSGVMGILVLILSTMNNLDMNTSINSAKLLGTLLITMTGVLGALGVIGLLGPASFIGIGALTTLIAAMTGIVIGIGALVSKFPMLEEFVNKGGPILGKIGDALGAFLGGIVGGVLGGIINSVSNTLPGLGTSLSEFMENSEGFINGASSIDANMPEKVLALADGIAALAKANFINGITELMPFVGKLEDLGTELSDFMKNVKPFLDGVTTINPDATTGVKNLAEAIQSLTTANFIDGLTRIIGTKSLGDFAEQFKELGKGVVNFSNSLSDLDTSQTDKVSAAADIIKILANAANEIPATGGMWQKLFGENSLATFASGLKGTGEGIRDFSKSLDGFENSDSIQAACDAITALANIEVPASGGKWQAFFGENSLATFAGNLPGVGEGISGFANKIGTFGQEQIRSIEAASYAMEVIAGLATSDKKDLGKNLDGTGKSLEDFAGYVKSFSNRMSEATEGMLTSATKKIEDLISMINDINKTDVSKLGNFGTELEKFASDAVKKFADKMSSEDTLTKVNGSISKMIESMNSKLRETSSSVENESKNVLQKAINGLKNSEVLNEATTAGINVTKGFVKGMLNNLSSVTAAGTKIGKTALKAAEKSLNEHSPSKETERIGKFFDLGLVNGINNFKNRVYRSAYNVGDYAKEGLSKAVSMVTDMMDSDMDTNPTIRPVIDLSDVESGIDYIDSMFGLGPSFGTMANLRAITNGINARNQNGTNNDIISAIDKLSDSLTDGYGNTYNINGVNYSENSDVATAIQTLVRAAKVERRK